jgi:teichuronic acid biosynthesis glycosyltransferase TuaC
VNVLTFSTLYPNAVQPGHGIFVENRLRQLLGRHDLSLQVVAPIPWFPFASRHFGRYGEYARAPSSEVRSGIRVHHPRYPVIPKAGMAIAPALLARWSVGIIRKLQQQGFDFDLIDAHYFYPDGVAAAKIARLLGKPLVITARGSDINLIASYPQPRAAIVNAANQAHAVVTVSESLRRAVIELGVDESRVHTLRNGVDLEFFTPPAERDALRRELGFTRPTLLCVGNLVELKGHHLVLEALRELQDMELVIAGAGVERDALERQASKLGLSQRVRFMGRVSQIELVRLYGGADALILASSREGWANVLLESMACGTPVAATPVSGNPEVVAHRDAGVLTRERSVPALVEAIRDLFATSVPRTNTRRYAQGFSWDETSDRLWQLFAGAADSNKTDVQALRDGSRGAVCET